MYSNQQRLAQQQRNMQGGMGSMNQQGQNQMMQNQNQMFQNQMQMQNQMQNQMFQNQMNQEILQEEILEAEIMAMGGMNMGMGMGVGMGGMGMNMGMGGMGMGMQRNLMANQMGNVAQIDRNTGNVIGAVQADLVESQLDAANGNYAAAAADREAAQLTAMGMTGAASVLEDIASIERAFGL
jgi:hypothetical protein